MAEGKRAQNLVQHMLEVLSASCVSSGFLRGRSARKRERSAQLIDNGFCSLLFVRLEVAL